MNNPFKYRAFISYSHSDEKWARWLHRDPRNLPLAEAPGRHVRPSSARCRHDSRRCFAIATSSRPRPTSARRWSRALEQSACQIVICSPTAAQVALGQRGNPRLQAPRARAPHLLPDRGRRARRIRATRRWREPGVLSARADPQAGRGRRAHRRARRADRGRRAPEQGPQARRAAQADRRHARHRLRRPASSARLSRRHRRLHGARDGLDRRHGDHVDARRRRLDRPQRGGAPARPRRGRRPRPRARRHGSWSTCSRCPIRAKRSATRSPRARSSTRAPRASTRSSPTQPAIQATLMDTMGTVYTSLGLYRTAIPLMREVAADKRRLLPGRHGGRDRGEPQATGRGADAQCGLRGGRPSGCDEALAHPAQRARQRQPEVANDAQRTGRRHVVHRRVRQGRADDRRRRCASAASCTASCIPTSRQSLGDLGVNFGERGDFKQADGLPAPGAGAAAQAARAPASGPGRGAEQPRLGADGSRTSPTEAEPLYREALDMKRKMLGDAHPELAAGLNNLAFVLETRGDYRGAEQAYRESLAMNRKLLGRQPSRNRARDEQSRVRAVRRRAIDRRRSDAARQSLEMSRRELGSEHPDVAAAASDLAYWLTSEGEYDEAAVAARRESRDPSQGARARAPEGG